MPGLIKFDDRRGFTLVEALVGTTLTVIVFLGMLGAYRLALKVVNLSKNKVTATSVANSKIEAIRNLSYGSVGTVGASLPEASGILDPVEIQTLNNTEFTITTSVRYVIDDADGTGGDDSCDWDYKKVDIAVTWGGTYPGGVDISTEVAPKTLVQEIESCVSQPGGVLKVAVFDAGGVAVPSPTIEIYDQAGSALFDSAIPSDGIYEFALEAGTYRVEVSKSSYVPARTYGSTEVAVPDSPNPSVLQGYMTSVSLLVDEVAALSVDSISPTGQDYFADPFNDATHISDSDGIQVAAGSLMLAGPVYPDSGWAISEAVAPVDIVAWDELMFDDVVPAGSGANYQLMYYNGISWSLIPDTDLAGNSAGFSDSPVNLAIIDKNVYPQLKLRVNLTTTDPNFTPSVQGWEVSWTTSTGVAVGGAVFHVRGSKTIGEDSLGSPVYKYDQDITLDAAGHYDIADVDGDTYTFSIEATSSMALIATDPSPQPISVDPGGSAAVKLFLKAQNALLVTVQNDATLEKVFSAAVRIYNTSLGYDKIAYTNSGGQLYFAPLEAGIYDVEIMVAGYNNYFGTAVVSGESSEIILIDQIE